MDHKRSQVQSSLEVTFLLKLFSSSLRKQYKNDNIANFVNLRENSFERMAQTSN